jgi:Ca2+-binding RTX toxin-like protein
MLGYDGDDILEGLSGDDDLFGGAGSDWLGGGEGDDLLDGDAGADTLVGGPGNDTASYTSSPVGVGVSLYTNTAYHGEAEGDTFSGIENLWGSWYNDSLHGDNNANGLAGHGGNDSLKGYGGADQIYGGTGHDVLWGMDGNDTLVGGTGGTPYPNDGNDVLYGGMGTDNLTGGTGGDRFMWTSTGETSLSTWTSDRVWDFNRAEGDLIDLSNVDADAYAEGNQAFTFIGTAPFSGTPGEVRYYHFLGETIIEMQTSFSNDVEGVIRLTGNHTLDYSCFVL